MRKLSSTERNILKPIFICIWPIVVPINILSDLIGSLTGNRNGVHLNSSNGKLTHAPNKLSWIDQLGNEVFGFNDINEDYNK